MKDSLTGYFAAVRTLEHVETVDDDYARRLIELLRDGWCERLPLQDGPGRPSVEIAANRKVIHAAVKGAGMSASPANLRKHTLRLTYALHMLNAAPRRDEETDVDFVKRITQIRKMAWKGDAVAIVARINRGAQQPPTEESGKPAKSGTKSGKRGTKGPKDGRTRGGSSGSGSSATGGTPDIAPEEPKVPTVADTGDALVAAYMAHRNTGVELRNAIDAHLKAGGTITKAMRTRLEGEWKMTLQTIAS